MALPPGTAGLSASKTCLPGGKAGLLPNDATTPGGRLHSTYGAPVGLDPRRTLLALHP